jgi:EmrB/QacA subfamily drug resistance transporter
MKQNSAFRVRATMSGLMMCLFLSALDNSIVATAMPNIISRLNGMRFYSLPFTSYLLFSTVVIPVAGKMSDVIGRKTVVLWGILFFIFASILCGMSANMLMLIIMRGFQGAFGGILASSAFIITSELFPPKLRGKYIGILASMHGLASLLGPVAGGIITEYLSWHWIFYMNIPIGCVAFFLIRRNLPLLKHPENKSGIDVKGILLFLTGIFPLLICFAEGGKLLPWNSPVLFLMLIISFFLLFLFIKVERISEKPLLPAGLLQNRIFRQSAIGASMAYIALFGLIIYVPYLTQIVMKKGAALSGIIMVPMSMSMVLGGTMGGGLISKFHNYRGLGAINMLLAICGISVLYFMGENISVDMLIFGIVITGLGIGMNFPVINLAPQSVFPQSQLGIVISSLEFFQIIGGVISTSVVGNIIYQSPRGVLLICLSALCIGLFNMLQLNNNQIRRGMERNSLVCS